MEIWEMSEKRNISKGGGGGLSLFLSIILVFCILGIVVFSVAQKLSREMSESAIQNLNGSLYLI